MTESTSICYNDADGSGADLTVIAMSDGSFNYVTRFNAEGVRLVIRVRVSESDIKLLNEEMKRQRETTV